MNLGSRTEFIERFGGIYEHSPWVAELSWVPAQDCTSGAELAAILRNTVDTADAATRLKLIRAHPDLAGRIALAGELTADSAAEQASAGLDQCSEAEYQQFQTLNKAYLEKFAFPFVMAVRGSHRTDILQAFAARLHNSYPEEFATAMQEIHKIAQLRLEQLDL